jgi:hypothetical protein
VSPVVERPLHFALVSAVVCPFVVIPQGSAFAFAFSLFPKHPKNRHLDRSDCSSIVSRVVERPPHFALVSAVVCPFLLSSRRDLLLPLPFLPSQNTQKNRHLDRSDSQFYRESRSGETPAFRSCLCRCLPFCCHPAGICFCFCLFSLRKTPKNRHLDRSDSQFYRESRSGETPAFRSCLCRCLPFCCHPAGICCCLVSSPDRNTSQFRQS